jgi:hypothetical protein
MRSAPVQAKDVRPGRQPTGLREKNQAASIFLQSKSSRATEGRPGTHSRAFPIEVPEWIPDLRFAASGMTKKGFET